MSQVLFFMDRNDTRSFVAFLIEQFGAEFALDQCATPQPLVFRSQHEVDGAVARDTFSPRFFVTSSQWEQFPLSVTEVHTNDGRHFFSIDQRYGGPAFDFHVARTDGERFIVPGWFMDYPYYCRKGQSETFNRPSEFASAFQQVRRYVRRLGARSVCRETGTPGPWIMPGPAALYARGAWLRQGDFHYDLRDAA
jgi:hypothetical protein